MDQQQHRCNKTNPLKSIPFLSNYFYLPKDSNIDSTLIRENIEHLNFHTDIIVAKGMQTGNAEVTLKLDEKGYNV